MTSPRLFTLAGGVLEPAIVVASTEDSNVLERTSGGLLLRDDFEDLADWTLGTGWSHRDEQTFVSFGKFPRDFFNNGGGAADDRDGVREPQLYVEGDTWWLLYDGGNHTTGWREFLASSVDRGLTWTRHGAISIGVTNGAGGSWATAVTGWLEKRGDTYYLHRVTTNTTAGGSTPGLPIGPYFWDTWSADELPGPWTWENNTPPPTSGATWASDDYLPCCVVEDAGVYYAFVQGGDNFIYSGGYATGPSPAGPWTVHTTAQFTAAWFGESRWPENVKVFYYPGFEKWVTIGNVIATDRNHTDRNFVAIGDSVSDWSAAAREYNQAEKPMDSDTLAVGVQCHLTGPDGVLLYDESTGHVPYVYDASGTSGDSGLHLGRTIHASELEVSPGAAQFDAVDTVNAYAMSRPLAHADLEVEFPVKFHSNLSGSSIQFWFRCNEAMTNGYRLVVRNLNTLQLQKIVAGVVTTVYSNPGGSLYTAAGPRMVHRLRFKMIGNQFTAWQDGQLHIATLTDSSHASGTHIALAGLGAHAEVRKLSVRTGVTDLVINGLPDDAEAVLRSYGGLPVEVVTTVGGTATFTTLTHGPYGAIDVDGETYTAVGGLWPGDELTA